MLSAGSLLSICTLRGTSSSGAALAKCLRPSSPATGLLKSSNARAGYFVPSPVSRLAATPSPASYGRIQRYYAKRRKLDPRVEEEKEDKRIKRILNKDKRLDLNTFFDDNHAVGEAKVYKYDKRKFQDDGEELPEAHTSDIEIQSQQEQLFRQLHGASEPEYEMAMGFGTLKPGDRNARFTPTETVASKALAESGKLGGLDLYDLDFESLKKFALDNELKLEDFFTKVRTQDGESSEISVKLSGDGSLFSMLDQEEQADLPIEMTSAYLRTQRNDPKNFRDRIRVRCLAGNGGKGGVTFYRDTRVARGPPDGGDGGHGGSVIFVASENKKPSLASLQPSYRAGSGQPGAGMRRKGKSGQDVVIEVPLGTTLTEFRSKPANPEEVEEDEEDSNSTDPLAALKPKLPPTARGQNHDMGQAQVTRPDIVQSADLADMTPEKRLESIEQAHRAKFSDPREGRPWAEPTLPKEHPMADSASSFHRMIENYSQESSIPEQIMPFSNDSRRPDQVLFAQGMEGYEMDPSEEMDYDLPDGMTGAELLDKYRLRPPTDAPKASNLPRTVELDEPGAYFVAAKGGAGGLGNWRLGAARNRPQAVATPGKAGESFIYQLELKLIADAGLVGFPNAGKSTFLSSVSRASPKIASYPFTTLNPEIGTVQLDDYSQFTIADLPGLIEGAHANRGLGHQFLKHIERTSVLVYLIDMSGGDKRDPWQSFLTLWDELERYNAGLVKKKAILVANKMDAGSVAHNNLTSFAKKLRADHRFKSLKIYPTSAASGMNMLAVVNALRGLLDLTPGYSGTSRLAERLKKSKSGVNTVNLLPHLTEAFNNVK